LKLSFFAFEIVIVDIINNNTNIILFDLKNILENLFILICSIPFFFTKYNPLTSMVR